VNIILSQLSHAQSSQQQQQQQQHLRGHDPLIAGSSSALNALKRSKVKGQIL